MNCEFCGKEFASISSLNRHVKTNKKCLESRGEKSNIVCQDCGKTYSTKSSLERHISSGVCEKMKHRRELIEVKMTQEDYELFMLFKEKRLVTVENLPIVDVPLFNRTVVASLRPEDCVDIIHIAAFLKKQITGKFIVDNKTTTFKTKKETHIMDTSLFVRTILVYLKEALDNYLITLDLGYMYDIRSIITFIEKQYRDRIAREPTLSISQRRELINANEFIQTIIDELVR